MNTRPEDLHRPDSAGPDRRSFLKGAAGLVVAFAFVRPAAAAAAQPASAAASFASPDAGKLYAWLAINPDNTATLFTGKVEVGTGLETALAQIAAEELELPIDQLDVVMGTTSLTVDQGPTYGSMSVRYAGPQIRHAAAAARKALLDLGADHFKLPAQQLLAKNGKISEIGNPSQSITYGELVGGKRLDIDIGATGTGFDMNVAPSAPVKDPSTYTVVGQSVRRKDIPGKVTGQLTYIHDVKVDGMLHGRVVRPFGIGAQLVSVDETGLKDIPGFVQVVRRGNFLGVVAETQWAAIQAADKLGSNLDPQGPTAGQAKWSDWQGLPPQEEIWDTLRKTVGGNTSVAAQGSVDMALPFAAKTLQATYETPFQMHGSIGPSCAIADVKKDGATFWVGTQMPHETRGDMATLLGLAVDQIEFNWYEASGAYGRNGLDHVIADAAVMSQAVGRPVRVQWMRWDEHGWEPKGPAIVQDLTGALDKDGNVTAWRHHMWVPTTSDTRLIAVEEVGGFPTIGSIGLGGPAITYAYSFANADVSVHGEGRVGMMTSWLRSPAQFETTYAMEAFLDELAAAANQDPLSFRLRYLTDQRAIDVLRAAADAYGWESRPSPAKPQQGNLAKGRGVAWVNRDDARVATIADITVDRDTGEIRVKRVVVAHDCGLVINPDGIKNQIEGNIVQSLSRTLHEEVTFDRAHVTSRDWQGYPILRFEEIPDEIEIVLVNNTPQYPSYGAGEPSTCPTAAVISNAVFDAVGVRLRRTPFRPERVKAAISGAS
ncbi:MAG TPA: molybdopterin cofactor-binding domain-containing protein [Devosiaceae bacterium]|nr:molybdopterin cofactor-binding domain-containing protein [Devosiaceae bacterium]